MCTQNQENMKPTELSQALMNYLDCPCTYFAPMLDDDEILVAYNAAVERGKKEGFVPILIAEDETLWECLVMNAGENCESADDYGFDAKEVADYREKILQISLLPGKQVIEQFIKDRKDEMEADDMDWEEDVLGEMVDGEANNRFIGYWDFGTQYTLPLVLAEIPVKNPWEIFAYLPFGGWNECPHTEELMAVSKYWYELHKAVPGVMTHDVLEFRLPAPVVPERAMQLALEQYAWCPDIVDQGGGDATVGTLADGLTKSKNWFFWWD